MDEDDAVDEGLDLSLFAVRSLVTTADLGCGMKEPVCGDPDRELLQLVDVLGAAMPEGPVGLLICLRCMTAAMSSFLGRHFTMHKHHNKQCSRRRTPTVASGTEQLKLARRRRHAEDVTSPMVIQCRERATPASRSKPTRKSDRRFRFRRTQIGNARVRYSSAGVSMSQTVQDSRPEARGVRFGRNKRRLHTRAAPGERWKR